MPFDPKTGEHDFAAVLTLDLLFRSEMDFVMNTARRCGLSDADAEDVTQQVFLALQRRLHTLQSPESVRPWLVTVTRRYARTKRGTKQEEPETLPDSLGEIEDEVPLAEEQILRSERRREVLDLLEEIDPVRRAVLVMHVLDEVPMREVAEALQIPIGTAYNRLRLARRDLLEAVNRKRHVDDFASYRRWGEIAWVRDPADFYYGRTAITQEVRDRIWARVIDAIRATFESFANAEIDGLRVVSPIFREDAPPRPYRLPKRRPKMLKSMRVPLPPLPGERKDDVTGSRTP